MGGLFYNGGDGKSLYIVGRGVLTPLLYEDPHHYTPYHPRLFFLILSNPSTPFPLFPVTSNLHPYCSFRCPVPLAEWVIIPDLMWCAILLNDNMDLHMSSLGTLVPEGPWYVFYAARCQVYGGLIYNVVFYWYPDITLRGQ